MHTSPDITCKADLAVQVLLWTQLGTTIISGHSGRAHHVCKLCLADASWHVADCLESAMHLTH